MPCYIDKIKPPSQTEFKHWQSFGYIGSYQDYCDSKTDVGSSFFICGDLGPHCADCSGFGDFLCDYPVGEGLTCDRSICDDHSHEIAPEIHYCEGHYKMWIEFRDSGGINKALSNVIAFKKVV